MIVTEQQIEDWAARRIQDVTGRGEAVLVGRQVTLPSGRRIDLLAMSPHDKGAEIVVVELKRDQANAAALHQLLGYMGELQEGKGWGASVLQVSGVLCAPSFTDDVLRAILWMPRVSFSYVEIVVEFEAVGPSSLDHPGGGPHPGLPHASQSRAVWETIAPCIHTYRADRLRRKRSTALVPSHLWPERVAYWNGKGALRDA